MEPKEINDPVFPVLAEGFPYILISLAAGLVLLLIPSFIEFHKYLTICFYIFGVLLLVFTAFFIFFFRNPPVKITAGKDLVLSPCNGKVLEIESDVNEIVIRTFLSIFSVHLQRSPAEGKVLGVEYKKGRFLEAWNPDAHNQNEQNIITIESGGGVITVRQIAGFLARRCVSRVKTGDILRQGNMIGLIKFSSQVDLHLPPKTEIKVKPGDKVKAGITVVGVFQHE